MQNYFSLLLCIIVFHVMLLSNAWSDRVKLENGDLLSGTIHTMQNGELTLQSSYMGELTFPWDMVIWLESDQPLFVRLQSGDQIHLRFISENGVQKMTSDVLGKVNLSLENITAISQKPGEIPGPKLQAAHETIDSLTKELSTAKETIQTLEKQTDLKDLWKGHVALQGNMRAGNRESYNAFLGTEAKRTTKQEEITIGASASYGETEDLVDTTEANFYSTLRVFYSQYNYVFGDLLLEHDRFESLDLRMDGTIGNGHRLWNTERSEFLLDYGIGLTEEIYKDNSEVTEVTMRLSFEYFQMFFDSTEFNQKFVAYPSVGNFGEYRFISTTSLITPISDILSWNISLVDEYDSDPRPGVDSNDVSVRTGLMYKF